MTNRPQLILGSGSPRRLELLAQIGVVPDAVKPPDIDEDVRRAELPRDYVKRIAAEKVAAVVAPDDAIVLCADTTVALGRRIMGKP
ncbi:MAG: Maf family protein, partial [Alphaproteobacteria bacterium]|nr:Maf family protein [Alphaproteobacteria bacterium]